MWGVSGNIVLGIKLEVPAEQQLQLLDFLLGLMQKNGPPSLHRHGSGWPSFDRQFEPYPRALWRRGRRPRVVACDAVPVLMVEHINKGFLVGRAKTTKPEFF
jgi:hypothetical protein